MTPQQALDSVVDQDELIEMVERIAEVTGKADPRTVFVACSVIMQQSADLMGFNMKGKS